MSRLALIGVPSSAGARRTGQERAPAALRAAGLSERLRENGLDVTDMGDQPTISFRPDPRHPGMQNLDLVLEVLRETAMRIDQAVGAQQVPLVLGGDCTVSLGVISGLLRHHSRLGLLYFDADLDLNTPETTPSGAFDGMVLAHALGRGAPPLADVGPRRPMLSEEDIALFGYDVGSGWIDPPELEVLDRSSMWKFPLADVRTDTIGAATRALHRLEERSDAFVVHFDVDVMDFPAVDVPHPDGLDPESAFAALAILVAAPKCAAIVVTELNADLDTDGIHARRLVRGLAEALRGRSA